MHNIDDTQVLVDYWDSFQLPDDEDISHPESPLDTAASLRERHITEASNFRRSRALSDATALMTSKQVLAPYHPALSLPSLIDTFGPLTFPLYRAALLRKRILFVGDAPMEEPCNFGISSMSLISSRISSLTGSSI